MNSTNRQRTLRITAAALAFLATSAIAVAAVGAGHSGASQPPAEQADSREAPAAAPVPDVVGVAAPQVGDKWGYNVTLSGPWPSGAGDDITPGTATHFADFTWRGNEAMRDAAGVRRTANVLAQSGLDFDRRGVDGNPDHALWGTRNATSWYAPGTPLLLAAGTDEAIAQTRTEPYVPGLPSGSSLAEQAHMVFTDFFGPDQPASDCFTRNALQGAQIPSAQPIAIVPACSLGGMFMELNGTQSFLASGTETVNGMDAIRFASAGPDGVEAWFNPSIPYPVRIHFTHDAATAKQAATQATLDLVGYEAGKSPLANRDDAGKPDVAPALVMKSRQAWGLDESGATATLLLSKAFQNGQSDPTWPDLRDYLAGHPDSYAAHVWALGEMDYDDHVEAMWEVTLSDGNQAFAFFATARIEHAAIGLPVDTTTYTFKTEEAPGFRMAFPSPKAIPQDLPTFESVAGHWSAYAGAALSGPGDAWSLAYDCVDEACKQATWIVTAGLDRINMGATPFIGVPLEGQDVTMDMSLLTMTASGATALRETTIAYQGRVAAAGEAPGGSSASAPRPVGSPLLFASALGSPGQAAGIAALSLFAAAATYLGMGLKGGAVGLFSRLRPERVREHPVRRSLLAVVASEPGIHYAALAERTGLPKGTLRHHLQALAHAGQVEIRHGSRYACVFPANPASADVAESAAKAPGARSVLATVRAEPGLTGKEVAERTGLQPSTVNYHVQRLVDAGLVDATRQGREVHLRPVAA